MVNSHIENWNIIMSTIEIKQGCCNCYKSLKWTNIFNNQHTSRPGSFGWKHMLITGDWEHLCFNQIVIDQAASKCLEKTEMTA